MICGKGPFFGNLPQPREKQFRELGGESDDDESICYISIYLPKSSYRDGSLRASVTINEKNSTVYHSSTCGQVYQV